MRAEIKKIQSSLGVTTIYVTHDQVEAMTMGDRVAVMRKGELQQVAPPQELYDHPVNVFVAGFIGSPAMNMLEARIERDADGLRAVVAGARLPVDGSRSSADALAAYEGRDVVLGIRPEALEDAALADPDRPRLKARVELREALGPEILVHFSVEARQPRTEEMRELAEDAGDEPGVARLGSGEDVDATVVGRFSPDTRVAEGETIEVAVDPRHLHFFDPASGRTIGG
jgi:multiple sugar transport system ATP-binding protein